MNGYYSGPTGLQPFTIARAQEVTQNFQAIAEAFDLLPDPSLLSILTQNVDAVVLVGQNLAKGVKSEILLAPQAAIDAAAARYGAEQALATLSMVNGLSFTSAPTKAAVVAAAAAGTLTNNGMYRVVSDETANGNSMLYRWRAQPVAGAIPIGIFDPVTPLNNVFPAAEAGLPIGIIAHWAARDYLTAVNGLATKVIPNRATTIPPEPLLNRLTGRQFKYTFSANLTWLGSPNNANLVITDKAVAGPLGRISAARIVGTGGNQYLQYPFLLPGGAKTVGIWLKSNTNSAQNVRLTLDEGASYTTVSVTPEWQRFTFSQSNSQTSGGLQVANDGINAWDVSIDMVKVYAGGSAQPDQPDAGHLYVGTSQADPIAPVVANGIFDATGGNRSCALAQFLDAPTSRELTISVLIRSDSSAGTNNYIIVDQLLQDAGMFDVAMNADINPQGNPIIQLGSGGNDKSLNQSRNIVGKGWHVFTGVVRHNRAFFYLDDVLMAHLNVGAANTERLLDCWRSGAYAEGLVQNYKWNQIVIARRAFSHTEVRQTVKAMALIAGQDGIGINLPKNLVVFEGDSIPSYDNQSPSSDSNKSYADLYRAAAPVGTFVSRRSIPGSVVTGGTYNLTDRAEDIDAALPPPPDRLGRKFILHVHIGTNDLTVIPVNAATFLANLAAYVDARVAAGWTVVLNTVLPRSAAQGGAAFNPQRPTINATIRSWVGGRIAAVADIAANATMGPDAAAENTSLYYDGLHPTTAGHAIIGPIVISAVTPLLAS